MFSGALTLTDLNDFITPSQACIKPVEQVAPQKSDYDNKEAASTRIHIDSAGTYYETSLSPDKVPQRKLEPAQISLNDCLACSGCITSAESVLITMQSHNEVISLLRNNPPPSADGHKTVVLSVSPQSLASFAATLSLSPPQLLHRIHIYSRRLGFHHVFDTTFARHLALLEHAREFAERKRSASSAPDSSHSPSLPMLASACPGWVCYAEKTHPEMLPFISRTKSPQQVMGTLVKHWLGQKWNRKPNQIYHVTVMPCYDKKLEASRQDFYDDIYSTRDVDCVITTGELDLMMREHDFDLAREPLPSPLSSEDRTDNGDRSVGAPLDQALTLERGSDTGTATTPLPELLTHPGSSSGAYLYTLLVREQQKWSAAARDTRNNENRTTDCARCLGREAAPMHEHAASETHGPELAMKTETKITRSPVLEPKLTTRILRNADYEEYTLEDPASGAVLFRGARCYGFRNLQNVVRRVGREAGVQVGRGAAGRMAGGVGRARKRAAAKVGAVSKKASEAGEAEDSFAAAAAARGYDYVEVMACPSGCVNGGGQLRPTTVSSSQTVTVERVGEEEDTSPSARWGDRAWTKRVEEAYWHDLPTPPRSPSSSRPSSSARSSALTNAPARARDTRTPSDSLPAADAFASADRLALQVLFDVCQPSSGQMPPTWDTELDEAAETRRRIFFRTEYRAVQSDVLGIQVQW